ncbi:hypothetical protein B0H13DRAFT_1855980 [Mycena leptocephala]|nr:hypothetical protein B0H13DRAFT_1855980 [Mycena leptocephala]
MAISKNALATFVCASCSGRSLVKNKQTLGLNEFDINFLRRPDDVDPNDLSDSEEDGRWMWIQMQLDPECVPPPMPFADDEYSGNLAGNFTRRQHRRSLPFGLPTPCQYGRGYYNARPTLSFAPSTARFDKSWAAFASLSLAEEIPGYFTRAIRTCRHRAPCYILEALVPEIGDQAWIESAATAFGQITVDLEQSAAMATRV